MMELVVSGGVPMGDIRLFLIAFGAILGAFAGILVGRYNIYIKLNKTNNFASDEEYKPVKQTTAGNIVLLAMAVGFAGFGAVCLFLGSVFLYGTGITIMFLGVLFIGAAALLSVAAVKGFKSNKS